MPLPLKAPSHIWPRKWMSDIINGNSLSFSSIHVQNWHVPPSVIVFQVTRTAIVYYIFIMIPWLLLMPWPHLRSYRSCLFNSGFIPCFSAVFFQCNKKTKVSNDIIKTLKHLVWYFSPRVTEQMRLIKCVIISSPYKKTQLQKKPTNVSHWILAFRWLAANKLFLIFTIW